LSWPQVHSPPLARSRSSARSLTTSYDQICAWHGSTSTDATWPTRSASSSAAAEAAERRGATNAKAQLLDASARLVEAQADKSLTPVEADELLSLLAQL
jgi:hypothetical protein